MGDAQETADYAGMYDGAVFALERIPAPVLLLDERQRIVFANAYIVHLFGYAVVELLDRPIRLLVPGGALEESRQALSEAHGSLSPWAHETSMEVPGLHKDGTRLSLKIHFGQLELDGRHTALYVIHDVTRLGNQRQTALIEARLNEAQRLAKVGSFTWDIVNDEHWWSDELYRVLQIDREAAGRPYDRFVQLVHPDDRQLIFESSTRVMAGSNSESMEVRVLLPDGSERIVRTQGEVTIDEHGTPIRMQGTLQDVTERKAAQAELQLTGMRYREAQRIAKIGSWEWNLVTRRSWWSDELYRILEEDPDQYEATFDNFLAKVHPEDRQILVEGRQSLASGPGVYERTESRVVLSDGRQKIVEQLVEIRVDEYGQPAAVIGSIHDITERRILEGQLRDSEARYASTVELAAVGIAHVDKAGRFGWSNRRLCDMLGYSRDELSRLTIWDVSHPDDARIASTDRERLHAGEIDALTVEKRYLRKDGTIVWVRIRSALRRKGDGTPLYDISIVEDITARKAAEDRVRYLAGHDDLTGLPNRALFGELLNRAIDAARENGSQCAVLFIDLDRFKIVNDSLGHAAGDLLLREVSTRLGRCIEESDVVARLGGDEFVVLIQGFTDLAVPAVVARKVLSALLAPAEIRGHECRITGSIGIATYPCDAKDASTLMKHADMAMYLAKEEGKNNYQFYSAESTPMSVEHLVLEAHLAHALERKELSIQYQPKVDIATGRIKGAEALLRWWNPELGAVPPTHFIPLAEDTGLIVPIGKWVMRVACEQNMAWQRRGLPQIVMSVNLSPRQFKDAGLVDDISEVLRQTGMAPELLELEITESMIMRNVDQAAAKAAAVKNLGVRLAIDDFGTGYSSLSQLQRFPIDTLKVDRSFIRDIPESSGDRAITEAIIALGRALGVTVVAEGVETVEQHAFLRDKDCDELQGFLFSEPCHPDAFAELLLKDRDR